MGFLSIARLGTELPGPVAQIFLAVARFHTAACSRNRLIGEMHRIGAHVGDVTAFIQALSAAHRLPR